MNLPCPSSPDSVESPWTRDGTYIIECTRRAHACCRTCEDTIAMGRLRVGVVYQHKNGYVCINWHHLECFPHVQAIPLSNLEGYLELDATHQQLVHHHQRPSEDAFLAPAVTASACSV